MKILGISAYYHDSAACITIDGKVVAAAQEERFTRKKHDNSFPAQAVGFCLKFCNLNIDDLDAVVYYEKPFLKFERLLETYYAYSPRGVVSFVKAIPVWTKEKLFMKKLLRDELREIMPYKKRKLQLLFTSHHLSHAASAFYPSPFNEAAIVTVDGAGEWATASLCHGREKSISLLKELRFPHSVGLLYSAFTYFLGFVVNSGEYKLMGLAPYGNAGDAQTLTFIEKIRSEIVAVNQDGSVYLHQKYFRYATGLRMINLAAWEKLFGFRIRHSEDPIAQHHCNLALAIQEVTEDIILRMAAEAKKCTQSENLVLAGGVALNCVANGKILKSGLFRNLFIQPAAGDAGGALGAALAAEYIFFDQDRVIQNPDSMNGAFLGPEYTDTQVETTLKKYYANYRHFESFDILAGEVASFIHQGKVVGWFQGRMEFGPRALGNRSILADARNTAMQKQLNLKIKFREGFRPFAPAVIAEDSNAYFHIQCASPYMLLVADINQSLRQPLPDNYQNLPTMDKLYTQRSSVQAITHCDFSARIQTVHAETNPRFYRLLQEFKSITNCSVMVNTSFNVRGEPIVCTPEEAFKCFMSTEMDVLVLNNFVLIKTDQQEVLKNYTFVSSYKPD
ncbi:MAG TPA: carbamoyltransferase [Bacteroidales bacterium]|nr:carbamoyltransferase [Bacteroidales bacterium]